MEEISVGEYIRTKDGIIGKVFEEDDIGDKGVCIDNSFFNDYAEITDFVYYENILKHSPNIIDLIEAGDYVNGNKVFATDNRINDNGEKVILTENYDEWTDNGVTSNKDIKTIVTKECFQSVSYEV